MKDEQQKILLLEKVFFKKNKNSQLRGVELFNFMLIKELADLGCDIDVVLEKSWCEVFRQQIPEELRSKINLIAFKKCIHPLLGVVAKTIGLALKYKNKSHYDVLLLGNVGNILTPAIKLLSKFKTFKKFVLVAHRETYPKFTQSLYSIPGNVVCVCGKIADGFKDSKLVAKVFVDYGIMNADKFHRANEKSSDGKVKFGVLGALDNEWKGADTAIAAYGMLPPEQKEKSELHLMAYSNEIPKDLEKGIIAYGWQNSSIVPDFLRSLDVLLVPSRDEEVMRETFSQATVQGMLTELPILYSDLPILKEKFDNGGGILCKTSEDFSKAMASFIENPSSCQEYGRQARATALERYVWDTKRFFDRYFV